MINVSIKLGTQADLEELLPLIADYQRFYRVEPDEAKNRVHFGSLLRSAENGAQFMARGGSDVKLLGFATIYFPMSSIAAGRTCYMCDLYVLPEMRGQGIGRKLIEFSLQFARETGYPRLWWLTEQSNATARRLYDAMGGERADWSRYQLFVN
jgi:ribosomal protein S18 acetylase RimI-like enzyme